jgi:hypothetical protein
MRKRSIFALLLLIVLSSPLRAQLPNGHYVRDVAAGDDLERVVNDALPKVKSTLAKIFKGKAKSRLRQVVTAAAWEQFTPVGDALRLETDAWSGERGITVRPGEAVRGWHRYWPNGKTEKLDVFTSHNGNSLTYRYVAEDGERTDTFTTDASGGLLTQDVTLQSSQLSAPIHYRLVYHRKAP